MPAAEPGSKQALDMVQPSAPGIACMSQQGRKTDMSKRRMTPPPSKPHSAWRWKSGRPHQAWSRYTEKEYDYAVSRKKDVLAFLHAAPEKLEAQYTEQLAYASK
jgi:hypothetical protein